MTTRDLTELLESVGARDGRLVHLEHVPARPGRQADWPAWADADLVAAYRRTGITRPWTHQVEAAEALHAGHHTVLATGTGSGKSLAAWLPALSDVLAAQAACPAPVSGRPRGGGRENVREKNGGRVSALRQRPTVMYLAPTKALAADQAVGLERLVAALEAVQDGHSVQDGHGQERLQKHSRERSPTYDHERSPTYDHEHSRPAGAGSTGPAVGLRTVRTGACDGDTPMAERDWVRAHADVVLTNPDFLHFSLLPGHERWTRLLRGLRYVVVDECHAYRGVLGAHVALVLRRLLRLVRRLRPDGPQPVVLCASATAAEPALTAARLIGAQPSEVVTVSEDGAPAGQRSLALWQPALRDPWVAGALLDHAGDRTPGTPAPGPVGAPARPADPTTASNPSGPVSPSARSDLSGPSGLSDPAAHADPEDPAARRSALVEASELTVDLLSVGARVLVFVRSRRSAEIVAERTRHTLGLSLPELAGTVAAYRGGYLPEERRALETDLRRGRLRALATTSALELGIDVTGLDAVVIAGWPGTRTSLSQQAGRAGRAGGRGLAVLIASDNPLDAYLVHHPEAVFASPEATVFDPANPYVLAPHLCAAASESPLRQEDLALFGLADDSLLVELEERGALRRRPTGWFWNVNLPGRPQDLTSLRGDGPPAVPVVETGTGTVIGTVDGAAADSTVHEGAVYVHQGTVYVVEELTEEAAFVRQQAAVGYRTRARSRTSVRILAERERQEWVVPQDGGKPGGDKEPSGGQRLPGVPAVTWSFGSVEVTSQVTGYSRLALPGMEVVSQHPLDMPERVLPTAATWWTLPREVCEAAGLGDDVLPGALHAAEHAAIGILPLVATCDRWDIGGLSTALHPQTAQPTVFVHDGHAGGAGFAERGYRAGRQWLAATLDVIEQCGCTNGCPSCVQSPKCGNNNEPLDKQGAAALLRLLVQAAPPGGDAAKDHAAR
ncbi:DEAD/DEAH box helicase [Actinomyces wuliandei]|uniref:DEAD/DEAH box helicase n=1 Tax=Actinomyces wuliandei TaxID=2057743 RepID=UPI000FDA5C8A|nr:DEAD/DEAH box helicase [Actinomyces wuliandei]